MSKCPNCGATMENNTCMYCRTNTIETNDNKQSKDVQIDVQQPYQEQRSTKNKGVMLVLVILFGMIGLHNFYAGRIGRGVLYFFTLGIFYVGWFYDIYKICTNQFLDGDGYPIKGN